MRKLENKEPTSTKSLPYRRLPGHVLVEEFLVPNYPLDITHLARRTNIPLLRLQKLIRGNDRIDKFIAGRLANFFRNEPEYWLSLQKRYERGESL